MDLEKIFWFIGCTDTEQECCEQGQLITDRGHLTVGGSAEIETEKFTTWGRYSSGSDPDETSPNS